MNLGLVGRKEISTAVFRRGRDLAGKMSMYQKIIAVVCTYVFVCRCGSLFCKR